MKAVDNPLFSTAYGTLLDTPDEVMTPVLSFCLKKRGSSTIDTELSAFANTSDDSWARTSLRWTSSEVESDSPVEVHTAAQPVPVESAPMGSLEMKAGSLACLYSNPGYISAGTEAQTEGLQSGVTHTPTAGHEPCELSTDVPIEQPQAQNSSGEVALSTTKDLGSTRSASLGGDQGGLEHPIRVPAATPEFDFYSTGGTDLWTTLQLSDHLTSAQLLSTKSSTPLGSVDANHDRGKERLDMQKEAPEQARLESEALNHACTQRADSTFSDEANGSSSPASSPRHPPCCKSALPQKMSMSDLDIEVQFSEEESNSKDRHSVVSTDCGESLQGTEEGISTAHGPQSLEKQSQGAHSSSTAAHGLEQNTHWDVQDERNKFLRMREESRVSRCQCACPVS